MNRRSFLKGLASVGAGLVLPPTLEENAEAARRFWALDQTMVREPHWKSVTYEVGQSYNPWIETTLGGDMSMLRPGDIVAVEDYFPGQSVYTDYSTREIATVSQVFVGETEVKWLLYAHPHDRSARVRLISRAGLYSEGFGA